MSGLGKNYVLCKTALDGKNCGVKATKEECAAECDKRDSCGEMYFKMVFVIWLMENVFPKLIQKILNHTIKKLKKINKIITLLHA